jgi:hypothetical protein
MSLSDQDLQKYVGKSLEDAKKELETQGNKICFYPKTLLLLFQVMTYILFAQAVLLLVLCQQKHYTLGKKHLNQKNVLLFLIMEMILSIKLHQLDKMNINVLLTK